MHEYKQTIQDAVFRLSMQSMSPTTLEDAQDRSTNLVKRSLAQFGRKFKLSALVKITSNSVSYVVACADIRGLLIPLRFTDLATKQTYLPDVIWGCMMTDHGDLIIPLGSFRPLNESEEEFIAAQHTAHGLSKEEFGLKSVKVQSRRLH